MSDLLYPWDEDFYPILHSSFPPGWRDTVREDVAVMAPDSNGLLTVLTARQAEEYREEHYNDHDDGLSFIEEDEEYGDSDLWLPY